MSKFKFQKLLLKTFAFFRVLIVAWMVGIANSVKQENRFMDDTNYQVEVNEEQSDDEPFEELP
ncbi:hypothetical protein [Roseivirga sp.]|uniref:hypothetical protein n=1 Tax=Roseivirga sp. TaxID=1964215 RepID=UPI002B267AF3|nr:hypothetical protein [Roseivirga sp.]